MRITLVPRRRLSFSDTLGEVKSRGFSNFLPLLWELGLDYGKLPILRDSESRCLTDLVSKDFFSRDSDLRDFTGLSGYSSWYFPLVKSRGFSNFLPFCGSWDLTMVNSRSYGILSLDV